MIGIDLKGIASRRNILILFIIGFSLFIMTSWSIGKVEFITMGTNLPTMKFNTALLFFFCTSCIVFINRARQLKWLFYAATVFIVALSFATLLQYMLNGSFGIDNLFVRDWHTTTFPGRMSPATAFCFSLLGVSLGLIRSDKRLGKVAQPLLFLLGVIAFLSLVMYILQINPSERFWFLHSMAFTTSVFFLHMSILLTQENSESNFFKILYGPLEGSQILKRLLPFNLFVPVVLAAAVLTMARIGWLNLNAATAVFVVSFVMLNMIYLVYVANKMNWVSKKKVLLSEALKESNKDLQRFKTALNKTSIVTITNPDGMIVDVNDLFCEVTGYSREEVIGADHNIVNSNFHPQEFFEDLWDTVKSGEIWTGDIRNRTKDGRNFWVKTSIVPFKDDEGNVIQFLEIKKDITAIKELEQIKEMNKMLENKNRELEQFAYIASHDLQEPLKTIQSFVDLLEKDYVEELSGEASTYMEYIQRATHRMSILIKGLLDYSRIGVDKELADIDLNQKVNDVMKDLNNMIEGSGAEIHFDNLPTIRAYKLEIRQLFQNLINNAIKFRKSDQKPEVWIEVSEHKDEWEISVRDNGIGIEEEHQDKIFKIFQRIHSNDKFVGTGIGLAYCRKIVELHGGRIWVTSKLDEGSTFSFTLTKNL